MASAKQEAEKVEILPDDSAEEDREYRQYVLDLVHERLRLVDAGDVISHDEAKRRMAKWLQD